MCVFCTFERVRMGVVTLTVGTILFPRPRDAAIDASTKAETQYETPITFNLSIPASATASLVVNIPKKPFPASKTPKPSTSPNPKAYSKLIK